MTEISVSADSTIALLNRGLTELGYRSEAVQLGGSNYTRFTAPSGQSWLTSNAHITYPFATASAGHISIHKHLAYELADSLGISTPLTVCVDSGSDGGAQLQAMLDKAPLIVKPDSSSLSRGLSVNLRTIPELRKAITAAREFSDKVLVQQQVQGEEIRFVVAGGRVRAAVIRQTARVVGDGATNLRDLITAENESRAQLQMPYLTYPQLAEPILDLSKFDLESIPAPGEVVQLARSTMIRGGASVYDITESVHESYKRTAVKLAGALGSGFVAVDMFISDYTQPQTSGNYYFIEFNMSPVFKLFYSCRDGRHYDVLADIVPMIDAALHEDMKPIGAFEQVALPKLGIKKGLAKIDTGAYSGALHCTDIKVVRRGKNRERVLKFTPFGKAKLASETTEFTKRYVRSASGHRIVRYIIETDIEIKGTTYPIRIGLADRSDMKKQILIGRRFLRQNKLLVDVCINEEHDDEGELL